MDAFNGVQGLRGWQWLFLLEGLPAIAMGIVAYLVLSNRPDEATWLSSSEKEIVSADIERSFAASRKGELDFSAALRKPAVWLFTLIYLGYYFALTSISTWWPTLLKLVGAGSVTQTGLLSGLISGVAAIGMILIGRSSDRLRERRWHVALCGFVGAAAFLCLPLAAASLGYTVILMMVATTGIFTVLGLFWTIPSSVLSGRAAAGGIALISSIGNLGGFLAPIIIGSIKDRSGSIYIGLSFVAVLLIGAMALLLFVVPKISRASSSVTSKTDTPHHQAASPVKVTDRYR
jgi:sugar phosphate permease